MGYKQNTFLLQRSKHGLRHMYFFAVGDPQAMTPEELRERRRVIGQWTRFTKSGKCDPAILQEWEVRLKGTDKRQANKALVFTFMFAALHVWIYVWKSFRFIV